MEKLNERLQSGEAGLATLDAALRLPVSIIVRDATIQRFEYSFESTWKLLKGYLEVQKATMPKKTKPQAIVNLTFEQAFAELEESVRTLERGDLPLEESLALYERGQELAAYCAKLLDEAELKIAQIEE